MTAGSILKYFSGLVQRARFSMSEEVFASLFQFLNLVIWAGSETEGSATLLKKSSHSVLVIQLRLRSSFRDSWKGCRQKTMQPMNEMRNEQRNRITKTNENTPLRGEIKVGSSGP